MEYTGVSIFGPERKEKEETAEGDVVGGLSGQEVSYGFVIFI